MPVPGVIGTVGGGVNGGGGPLFPIAVIRLSIVLSSGGGCGGFPPNSFVPKIVSYSTLQAATLVLLCTSLFHCAVSAAPVLIVDSAHTSSTSTFVSAVDPQKVL